MSYQLPRHSHLQRGQHSPGKDSCIAEVSLPRGFERVWYCPWSTNSGVKTVLTAWTKVQGFWQPSDFPAPLTIRCMMTEGAPSLSIHVQCNLNSLHVSLFLIAYHLCSVAFIDDQNTRRRTRRQCCHRSWLLQRSWA